MKKMQEDLAMDQSWAGKVWLLGGRMGEGGSGAQSWHSDNLGAGNLLSESIGAKQHR